MKRDLSTGGSLRSKVSSQLLQDHLKNDASDLIPFVIIQLLRFEKRAHGNTMLWWHFDDDLLQIANQIFGIKCNFLIH